MGWGVQRFVTFHDVAHMHPGSRTEIGFIGQGGVKSNEGIVKCCLVSFD
jgi:hypothetical protein